MVSIVLSVLCLAIAAAVFVLYFNDRLQVLSMRYELDRITEEKNIIIEFLHKTAEDIGSDADRMKLYRRILRATALSCGAMSACVYEKLPDGTLKAKAVEGLFPPQTKKILRQKNTQLRSNYLENSTVDEVLESNEGIIGTVANEARGVLIKDATKDPRIIQHEDESFKVRSIMFVPMIFAGQLHGVLAVANPISGKAFTETDFSLAKSLGEQAGLALHSRDAVSAVILRSKLEFDLKLASSVQRYLLPASLPATGDLDCAVKYRPQKLIGGDFYDFIELGENKLGVVIGDVSGKGISAAIIMAICQTTLRHLAPEFSSPSEALKALNSEMVRAVSTDMFITVLYAVIDTEKSTLTLARAGHEQPILCQLEKDSQSHARKISSPGMAVGMVESEIFNETIEDVSVPFRRGDIFVLYTDGITEAEDEKGEEFSSERLAEMVCALSVRSSQDLNREIIRSVERFMHKKDYLDDLTLLTIKRI